MRTLFLPLILLAACTLPIAAPPPMPTPTPLPYDLQPAIDAALRFLEEQYNADYGLLQESPDIGAHRYFLANDALLAAHVFELYRKDVLAATLRSTLADYGVGATASLKRRIPSLPWPCVPAPKAEANQVLRFNLGFLGGVILLALLGGEAFLLRQVKALLSTVRRMAQGEMA